MKYSILLFLILIFYSCSGNDKECSNHLDCKASEYCDNGSCKPLNGQEGKPCKFNGDCGGSGICINGICQYAQECSCKPDDPCTQSTPSCTSSNKKCTQASQCNDNDECTDDLCIDGDCVFVDNHKCCKNDSDCQADSVCKTGKCVDKKCVYQNIENCCEKDADCNNNDSCTMFKCVDNRCVPSGKQQDCCENDSDCDDGNDCTKDVCNQEIKKCSHIFQTGDGCCSQDSDCDDGIECTVDLCCTTGSCCFGDKCYKMNHCYHKVQGGECCLTDEECDDSKICTKDYCENFKCIHEEIENCCVFDSECNDYIDCTEDKCINNQCKNILSEGCCVTDSDCNDNSICTWDYCKNNNCVNEKIPNCCESDEECDDNDPCTKDFCSSKQCEHQAIDNCCFVNADCDDNDPCTKDMCIDNLCVHKKDTSLECCTPTVVYKLSFDGNDQLNFSFINKSTLLGFRIVENKKYVSPPGSLYYGNSNATSYQFPGTITEGTAISDEFSLPDVEKLLISFKVYLDILPDKQNDKFELFIYKNGSYAKIWDKSMIEQSSYKEFVPVFVDISDLKNSTTRIKFYFNSLTPIQKNGQGVFIDDIIIGYGCDISNEGCQDVSDCYDNDPCTGEKCMNSECSYYDSQYEFCTGKEVFKTSFYTIPSKITVENLYEDQGDVSWHLSGNRFYSPPYSLYFGGKVKNNYEYENNPVGGKITISGVDLGGLKNPFIAMYVFMDIEKFLMIDKFKIKVNGNEIFSKNNDVIPMDGSGFYPLYLPLDDYKDQTVDITIIFDSVDGKGNDLEGIYIDDLIIGDE